MGKIFYDIVLVATGASLGALLRYFSCLYLPAPILLVNLLGSFLIGLLYPKLSSEYPQYIHLINTGFLGALTTFSSFSLELVQLFEEGDLIQALLYIFLQLVLCVGLCFYAYKLGIDLL